LSAIEITVSRGQMPNREWRSSVAFALAGATRALDFNLLRPAFQAAFRVSSAAGGRTDSARRLDPLAGMDHVLGSP
jgi:hypothetical protein